MKVITSVFVNFILYLGLFAFCSSALYAKELVRIGVHLEHSEEPMNDLWQSFAGYLAQEMDDVSVEVTLLEHDELDEKLKRNNLDFILVDPAFYIQLNQVNGLVRVIATVRESYRGDLIPAQAGAIIARADRDDISTLKDLKNKTVGVESKEHLVTYQSQMYILHQAGVSVPDDVTLKMFHDQDRSALDAEVMLSSLLNGEIDVAFMRGGALEKMIDQGGVRKADFKIINKQHFPGYPFAVSTHLYPERPLVMMPHVEQRLAQKLVSVLYSIDPALPLLSKLNIYNFTVPMDYTPVFNVARELHLPPFDSPYDFSIVEIWKEYYIWFVILFIAILSIIMLAIVLGLSNRNLRRAREHIENGRRELARTASILSGTLENSPNVAIQWCDEIGRVRYWNPASESFYGWSSAEALDRTLDELIFMSGSRQGILEILMDAREHQAKSKPVEVNVRGQNNNQLTVLLSVFNANVADEIIFVCMQVDVSERKLAESAIRQSNERFDLVMQASNDGLWDWNLVTNEVYYSPRWKSMLGYNDHELQNKFSSWETNIDSDGLSRVTDLIEQCINGSRPGFEAEFRMRHKDGNWIDILSRGMVVRNETGQAIRFVGTHVDLTDHKQLERSLREQEQQLAQIIDHLPSMIYLKDARDLTYVHINTVFETLTGLSKSEVLGHQEYEFFPEQQASYFSEQDQTILASSNTGINSEEEINSPFGMRTLHTLRVAIKDETGQPKYLLGISEDITEQKAAKTEQERLQRELQQAHKMDTLGQLTGGIAHDFNNLLS
ncbi:MAG: PAS domain S-box protein, partial [Gammaproteobacteria bacterium]|nr:PAS domain S-box protein [Gammaproteobacteria bacterium]